MQNKICPECSTENEQEYQYCKNCGVLLPKSEEKETAKEEPSFIFENEPTPETKENTGYNPCGIYGAYDIGGIPADDVALFVGKKAHNIMPKFMKMEMLRSKSSWCWPVAVLGYIFGPIGASFWFFYRKMYKTAFALLAIGAVLTLAISALTYNVNAEFMDEFLTAFSTGDIQAVIDAAEGIEAEDTLPTLIANAIENISSISTCILTGIFGFYAYKEHCIKTIIRFRESIPDNRYYKIGLASVGGVSGGMVAVGIISFFFIESIASTLNIILSTIV